LQRLSGQGENAVLFINDSIKTNSRSARPGGYEGIRGRILLTLVRKARNRWLRNELLSQGAAATSAALVAVILLLLMGTQILDWRWAAAIPLAALAIGAYLVRRRMPASYVIAQIVDRRLELADTLSTALFFQENPSPHVSEEVCALQLERANRLAETADVRRAIPYTVPRAVYPLVVLILVASSLFALRYGLTRRLDLSPPLARILEQNFGFETHAETARNTRKPLPPQRADPQDDNLASPDPQEMKGEQPVEDPENAPEAVGEQQEGKGQKKAAEDGKSTPGEETDKAEGEDKGQQGDDQKSGDDPSNSQQAKGDQKQDPNGKQDANSSGDNSSLMSKMKDAFQNLLSKVKPQQGNSPQQQNGQNQNGKQSSKAQQDGKQQASKDGQKQDAGQQSDSQEGESGDQAQESQDPQSKGSGKSDAQQASKQPGSGIGSQDGDKTIKQAEQLAAMGKISEILGKRSATITGEATVEVQSTSQQLRTPYAQRGAQHSQGGAEINRDEVPVAMQTYVEKYFEQVRKQPPPPAATPKANPPAGKQ
jgi:hypothetical protein